MNEEKSIDDLFEGNLEEVSLKDLDDEFDFTEEEERLMDLGIIVVPYVRGWKKKHDKPVFTTKDTIRESFMSWYLDNFTEYKDLDKVKKIDTNSLKDNNTIAVANKITELEVLKEGDQKEEKTIETYINELEVVRNENNELKEEVRELKTHILDTTILKKMIPLFVEKELTVNLHDNEIERIKEYYTEMGG